MADILTLSDRKQARIDAIRAALPLLENELQAYARSHQGRYLIFGSMVTGHLHYESDVDLLADFSREKLGEALDFANELGTRLNVPVDVVSFQHCKPEFLKRILPNARVLA